MNIALTLGTFDVPHEGHISLFHRASKFGPLFVALNTDEFVAKYKGKKPVMTLSERASMVEKLPCVSGILVNEDEGKTVINKLNPEWIIIGSDWMYRDYPKQLGFDCAGWEKWKARVIYVPYGSFIPSSEMKHRLLQEIATDVAAGRTA